MGARVAPTDRSCAELCLILTFAGSRGIFGLEIEHLDANDDMR